MSTGRLRVVVTVLLVVSAGLFAIGVAIERDSSHGAHGETHAAVGRGGLLVAADEHTGESPAQREAERQHREAPAHAKPAGESAAHQASERRGERVFGIDIESTGLVIAAVAVSLSLAVALWLTGSVVVPLALAGFALAAAIFDVREVFHQIDESRTNLTLIAAIVAALHLALVAGALVLARRSETAPG
jgi:hypothetical protein